MIALLLMIIVYLLTESCKTQAQNCLRSTTNYEGDSLPYFEFGNPRSGGITIGSNPIQAIVTSYQFHCCGEVNSWGVLVSPGVVYSIAYQVWRPNSTSAKHYFKVGEQYYRSICYVDSLQLGAGCEDGSQRSIQVQPGDVFGYYLEQEEGGNSGGLQHNISFTQETTWYALNNPGLRTEHTLQVGPDGELEAFTNLGPVVTVIMTQTECPSNLSTATSPPSSSRSMPTGDTNDLTTQITNGTTASTPDGSGVDITTLIISVSVSIATTLTLVAIFSLSIIPCLLSRRKKKSKTGGYQQDVRPSSVEPDYATIGPATGPFINSVPEGLTEFSDIFNESEITTHQNVAYQGATAITLTCPNIEQEHSSVDEAVDPMHNEAVNQEPIYLQPIS